MEVIMKKTLTKILFISLLFSAAVPSSTMQANLNLTALRNGAAEIGSKTINWLTTNGGNTFNFFKKHPIAVGTVVASTFLWKARKRILSYFLWREMQRGDRYLIRTALYLGADTDAQEWLGDTLLTFAVNHNDSELVELLLKHKAAVNKQNKYGWTALTRAADHGYLKIVKLLVDNGANVDHQDQSGWTALTRVAYHGNSKMLKLLVDSEANVDHQVWGKYNWTALMLAADHGNSKIVKLLVDGGANVDHQDQSGWTAFKLGNDEVKETINKFKREKISETLKEITTGEVPLLPIKLPDDLADLISDFTY